MENVKRQCQAKIEKAQVRIHEIVEELTQTIMQIKNSNASQSEKDMQLFIARAEACASISVQNDIIAMCLKQQRGFGAEGANFESEEPVVCQM